MDYISPQITNTNPGIASASAWGQECMDEELLSCKTNADCISLAPSTSAMQCYRGVCVMDMNQSPSCYSHRDCARTDQMCSGDGKCVDPVLQVCPFNATLKTQSHALCLLSLTNHETHRSRTISTSPSSSRCMRKTARPCRSRGILSESTTRMAPRRGRTFPTFFTCTACARTATGTSTSSLSTPQTHSARTLARAAYRRLKNTATQPRSTPWRAYGGTRCAHTRRPACPRSSARKNFRCGCFPPPSLGQKTSLFVSGTHTHTRAHSPLIKHRSSRIRATGTTSTPRTSRGARQCSLLLVERLWDSWTWTPGRGSYFRRACSMARTHRRSSGTGTSTCWEGLPSTTR